MKQIARIILSILLLLASSEVGLAQEPSHYRADGWRGLTLDQSSVDDATRTLGSPAEDKVGDLHVRNASEWMTAKRREKVFRKLVYKNFEEVKKAELSFLDNKLVMISLMLKQPMAAKDLAGKYGTDFVIIKGVIPKGSRPGDYEGGKQGFAPGAYPPVYIVVTVSARSFVAASVVDVSAKNVLKRAVNSPTKDALPGNVFVIETISRRLSL
jgi:hypothetical protein